MSIAIIDPRTGTPNVKLAIEGCQPDGWHGLGRNQVREKVETWSGGKNSPP